MSDIVSKRAASLQFTLRQMILITTGLAIGFAIWRLPKGQWIDIPLAAVSVGFCWSLLRHAVALKRSIRRSTNTDSEQRAWCWTYTGILICFVTLLVFVLCLRVLAARDVWFQKPEGVYLFAIWEFLPLDMTLLTLTVVICLDRRLEASTKNQPIRKTLLSIWGAFGGWLAIFALAAYWSIITALVCIAVLAIEAAQPVKFAYEGLETFATHRVNRFVVTSFIGGLVVLLNILLFVSMDRRGHMGRRKNILLGMLLTGLMAEVLISIWILRRGIYDLSPSMAEGLWSPSFDVLLPVGGMIFLTSFAIAWRICVTSSSATQYAAASQNKEYFHQSWLAALLVGLIGAASYFYTLFHSETTRPRTTEEFLYFLFGVPSQYFVLAAMVAGFSNSWTRWKYGPPTVGDIWPTVNPFKLIGVTCFIAIAILAAGPIFGALGLAFWFSPLRDVF